MGGARPESSFVEVGTAHQKDFHQGSNVGGTIINACNACLRGGRMARDCEPTCYCLSGRLGDCPSRGAMVLLSC